MKYSLIDKIISLDEGKEIKAVKSVSLAEEYLGDHFPAFPVLPGVFLLQGMVETASWLVRTQQDFSNSMVLLERARNVTYKSFAAPGMQVLYTAQVKKLDDKSSSFTVSGNNADEEIVKARIDLRHFNLSDDNPAYKETDAEMVAELRLRLKLLTQNSEL